MYGDDANYAKADLVSANGNRVLEFLRESNNVPAGFGGSVSLPSGFPDTVEIRIVSDGEMLRAEYRQVGGEWAPFGEPAALAAIPSPKLGVYANDSNQTVDHARAGGVRLLPAEPRPAGRGGADDGRAARPGAARR